MRDPTRSRALSEDRRLTPCIGDRRELETIIGLLLAAVLLAAAARRLGAPYPVFLALGGALLASPRDLKDNWAPLISLVVVAVGLTTLAVAVVVRTLIPAVPWAPAIALGAVVAPPEAAAATAVLRGLRPPHRILTILEGESLLNDARCPAHL